MESSRRALLLREMGLSPVWRLRVGEAAGGPFEAQGEVPADVKVGEKTARQTGFRADASVRIGGASPESAAAPRAHPAATPVSAERAARILEMDWPQLKAAVSGCQSCALCTTRKNTVFGVGDERADWLLVGEAPGAEEDASGEPFVGQAGRLLDNMLASLGLKRGANVYIANVLKCRPPGNRNPDAAEVAQCSPYLQRQIQLVQPKLILAMGRFAAQALLETDATIASLRGRLHSYRGVPLIVSYHPAYLLRSLQEKAKAWEDLCFARRTIAGL